MAEKVTFLSEGYDIEGLFIRRIGISRAELPVYQGRKCEMIEYSIFETIDP